MNEPRDYILPIRPISLTVEITRGCNLSCPMCLKGHRCEIRFIDKELFLEILRQTRSLDLQWLRFCGDGEPALNPSLPYYVQCAQNAGLPIVGFVTNGTRLSNSVIEQLRVAGLNFIAVSLDATTESTYAKVRRGKTTLAQVESSLIRLLEVRHKTGWQIEVQVNFLVQPANRQEVFNFETRWSGKVDRINFLPLTSHHRSRFEEFGKFEPCYMLRSKLYVSVDGDVYPCFFLHPPVDPLGNVRDASIQEIWETRRKKVEGDPAAIFTRLCSQCNYTNEPLKIAEIKNSMNDSS